MAILNGPQWASDARPGGLLPVSEAHASAPPTESRGTYPLPSLKYPAENPGNCSITLAYSPSILEDVASTIRSELGSEGISVDIKPLAKGTTFDLLLQTELYYKPQDICYLWNWFDPNQAKGRIQNPLNQCQLDDLDRWHAVCSQYEPREQRSECPNNDRQMIAQQVAYFEELHQQSDAPVLILDYFQPYVITTTEKDISVLIEGSSISNEVLPKKEEPAIEAEEPIEKED